MSAVGNPLLLAVEHPAALGSPGARGHARRVAPDRWLTQRKRTRQVLAARELRQMSCALFVAPELLNDLGHHVRDRHCHGGGGTGPRDLHHCERVRDHPGLGASPAALDVDSHQPESGELPQGPFRKLLVAIELGRPRQNDARGEIARRLLYQSLGLADVEVHRRSVISRSRRASPAVATTPWPTRRLSTTASFHGLEHLASRRRTSRDPKNSEVSQSK